MSSLANFIIAVVKALAQQQNDVLLQSGHFMSKGCKRADSSGTDDCFLEIDRVVNESDVRGRVFSVGTLQREEIENLRLYVSVFAVLNMLSQDQERVLSLGWANLDDRVDDRLPEQNVWIVLQTVAQELEE